MRKYNYKPATRASEEFDESALLLLVVSILSSVLTGIQGFLVLSLISSITGIILGIRIAMIRKYHAWKVKDIICRDSFIILVPWTTLVIVSEWILSMMAIIAVLQLFF